MVTPEELRKLPKLSLSDLTKICGHEVKDRLEEIAESIAEIEEIGSESNAFVERELKRLVDEQCYLKHVYLEMMKDSLGIGTVTP